MLRRPSPACSPVHSCSSPLAETAACGVGEKRQQADPATVNESVKADPGVASGSALRDTNTASPAYIVADGKQGAYAGRPMTAGDATGRRVVQGLRQTRVDRDVQGPPVDVRRRRRHRRTRSRAAC